MKKYIIGDPIPTEAVVADIPSEKAFPPIGTSALKENSYTLVLPLSKDAVVYGLGESPRGMNKRGWEYISYNCDDPMQTESRRGLYGSHNFLIADQEKPVGLFIDTPGKVRFDIGYTKRNELSIESPKDVAVYVIEGDSPQDIAHNFRKIIGKSYIPPKFAFGYGQSRWGYKSEEDLRNVADELERHQIPCDMIYMDIDYMQGYKDFTVNESRFPDFPAFVEEMKKRHIHLVPIIDAGVKKEEGYPVYEEGVEKGYFVKEKDQETDFVGAVWPGYALLPDFLNPEARAWFGEQYRVLTDAGIDAFWNDMNEPALFYSEKGLHELTEYLRSFIEDPDSGNVHELEMKVAGLNNSPEDFRRFYHRYNGKTYVNEDVHNLYGFNMTRGAAEAFDHLRPDLRTLIFSRSSYIGMHRYAGIWTGDNKSWFSHIKLLLSQLPGLNMAGFLYTGADLGGFTEDTTPDLLARFIQLGVFTPLMRNHSAILTRDQEPYQFENVEELAHLIQVRYRLLPYLYSEYLKAALNDEMMFRPLSFEFRDDPEAREVDDQLLLGDEVMIAPVYEQNKNHRYVYLPEEMIKVAFKPDGSIEEERLAKGHHYIEYPLDEIVFFIRKGKAIPVAAPAMNVDEVKSDDLLLIGDTGTYQLYEDDGIHQKSPVTKRILKK